MMRRVAAIGGLSLLILSGCAQRPLTVLQPPLGANEVLRAMTSAAPGHELIVSDLLLGPNAVGSPHSHPWEEYLYVIGGSALVDVDGSERRSVAAGEAVVLPGKTVHTPRAGPEGVRAIVIRVHDAGDPLSIPVVTEAEPHK